MIWSKTKIAIVQVPSVIKSFIEISTIDGSFAGVLFEDVIVEHISKTFSWVSCEACEPFQNYS